MAERAALPLAIARQPLWAIGGWLATLDGEKTARDLAAVMSADVERAETSIRCASWTGAHDVLTPLASSKVV
jgi:hypothetical protein